MATYQTKMESLQETPYFDITSVKAYAEEVLEFVEDAKHHIVLTIVSRTLKETGKHALVLHIDGDVKQADGSFKHLQATAWSNLVPTDEEFAEYAAPQMVQDATLRWGAFANDKGELVWAENPKLKSWVTMDGEVRTSQSTVKSWGD